MMPKKDVRFLMIGFSFYNSLYIPKKIGVVPFFIYQCLRCHVWRSSKGELGGVWEKGYLAAKLSHARLAELAGVNRRTVIRHLDRLKKIGWIKTYGGASDGKALVYVLGSRKEELEVFFADIEVDRACGLESQVEEDEEGGCGVGPQGVWPEATGHPYNGIDKYRAAAAGGTKDGGTKVIGFSGTSSDSSGESDPETSVTRDNSKLPPSRIDSGDLPGTEVPVPSPKRKPEASEALLRDLSDTLRAVPGDPVNLARFILSETREDPDPDLAAKVAEEAARWNARKRLTHPRGAVKSLVRDRRWLEKREEPGSEGWEGEPLGNLFQSPPGT